MKYTADCPECLAEFEVKGPTTASLGVMCDRCGHKFTPEKVHRITDGTPTVPTPAPARTPRSDKTEETAFWLSVLAALSVVIAILCLIGSGLAKLNDGTFGSGGQIATGLFGLAVTAFFFSQLFYIRAALEKIADKE